MYVRVGVKSESVAAQKSSASGAPGFAESAAEALATAGQSASSFSARPAPLPESSAAAPAAKRRKLAPLPTEASGAPAETAGFTKGEKKKRQMKKTRILYYKVSIQIKPAINLTAF